MMDVETFFFGKEALEAGFIDEIVESEGVETDENAKKSYVAIAKEAYEATLKKVVADDYEQAAAYLSIEARGDNNPKMEEKSKTEETFMNLNEFMAKHPDLYAEVYNKGVADERDRVSAHLIMGSASGDLETAKKAIEDGSAMTETIKAKYSVAALNKRDINARLEDENDVADITDNINATEEDAMSTVADLVEARLGIEKGVN